MLDKVKVNIIVVNCDRKVFDIIEKLLTDEHALAYTVGRFDDGESKVLMFTTHRNCIKELRHDVFRLERCGIDIKIEEISAS